MHACEFDKDALSKPLAVENYCIVVLQLNKPEPKLQRPLAGVHRTEIVLREVYSPVTVT